MKAIYSDRLVTTAAESLGSKKPHYRHDFAASPKVPFVWPAFLCSRVAVVGVSGGRVGLGGGGGWSGVGILAPVR